MIKRELVLCAVLASLCCFPARSQGANRFHFTERPGAYAVGLKVVEQYDPSRTWGPKVDSLGKQRQDNLERPLQTLVWYPAEKSNATPMTVGDYFQVLESETSFARPHLWAGWADWKTGMAPTLEDPMWSVRDARAAVGHFPIVIYAPSFGSMAWENADLCEYLASNGYIVLASGALGPANRFMTTDLAGIEAQAADISFLVGYAQRLPNTDPSQVAVAGFSWGGICNLFAASRDSRITALVALDGSMRYFPGLVAKSGYVHPEQMTIPLLFFAQGEFLMEDQARYLSGPENQGPNVLNAWTHGDLMTVHLLGMVHQEYSSMYQRNEDIWGQFPEFQKADYGREDGIAGYAWMARYTLAFLDAYLKHDTAAHAWLKKTPAENGVPHHFVSTSLRPANGVPTNFDGFRTEVGKRGFDHAKEIYDEFHKQNADFNPDETTLIAWGYALMDEQHVQQSIVILQLGATLHPDSADIYDTLGDAYAKAGQKQQAIESYQKSRGEESE